MSTRPFDVFRRGARAGSDYRPDLDGVRAFAVLGVLAMHSPYLGKFNLDGGGVGVDVFFVLSGYLITSLLVRELDMTGRIRFAAFYLRRTLRLLPALVVVLIFGAIVVVIIGDQPGDRGYPMVTLAALLYVANWFVIFGGMGILGHVWSLSIEEQYYLVWPITLSRALRVMSRRSVALTLVILAVAVALGRYAVFARGHWLFAATSTFTRPDGILLGSALALALADDVEWLRRSLEPTITAVVGTVAILAITFTYKLGSPLLFEGGLSVVNVGAVLLIGHLVVRKDSLPKRFLSLQPLPGLGRISYGLYLYHLPMNFLIHGRPARWMGPLSVIASFSATIAMALLSYAVIEQRALRLKARLGALSEVSREAVSEPNR